MWRLVLEHSPDPGVVEADLEGGCRDDHLGVIAHAPVL